MRLSLGTVQFGMRYGIANEAGQVDASEAAAILRMARDSGVNMLDTAVAYGASEECLGSAGVANWQIVTKLPPFPAGSLAAGESAHEWVRNCLTAALARMRVDRIYGLLLHRPADLTGPEGETICNAMLALRASGLVQRIGISVYEPSELDRYMDRGDFDLVQAPFNVFDRRLESSGWLARLKGKGVEIHTRSVFLQGLLLMHASKRPAHFQRWSELWSRWDEWLAQHAISALHACLAFALGRPQIDKVIVGVDGREQLRSILAAASDTNPEMPPGAPSCDDPELLNPALWPKT